MLMQHSASLTLLLKYLDLRTPPRMLGCSPAAIGRRRSRRPTATVRVRSPAPEMSGEIHSLSLPAHFWVWESTDGLKCSIVQADVLPGLGLSRRSCSCGEERGMQCWKEPVNYPVAKVERTAVLCATV